MPHSALSALSLACAAPAFAASPAGVVETKYIDSRVLEDNRVGLSLRRSLKVYLPPGYSKGKSRYPVVYMLHGLNWSNERMFAPESTIRSTFDRAIADGVIRPFIAVAPDYTTTGPGHVFREFDDGRPIRGFHAAGSDSVRRCPLPDAEQVREPRDHGRTHGRRMARCCTRFIIPRYSAPCTASIPSAPGSGLVPMYSRPDWKKVYAAKSFADISGNPGDPYTPVFVAMAQTFLPNADRPPFYCDYLMEPVNGEPQLDVANLQLLKSRFMLEKVVVDNLDKVRALRGIKFDWGRYDPNQDHVYANQAFTRKLDELGIEHEAEEYRGLPWDKYWIEDGRVYTEVLPFFARHMEF